MKILVLNGRERSNTLKLTKAFLEGLTQNRAADIEILDIYQLNVHACRGCFACWNKTPGKCVMDDDMAAVIQKILLADVILYSFPLYYFSLPSRLKMLIDRQLPMCLPFMEGGAAAGGHPSRYDMSGKRYVVISTCGFHTAEDNYEAVRAQFDKMYGESGYTALYCGQGELFRVPELRKRTDEYLQAVQTAGAEFAGGTISDATRSKLNRPLFPREVFEQMADASWGIEKGRNGNEPLTPALSFTRQMAALYNPTAWQGHDLVLELAYTDVQETYQVVLQKDGQTVLTENFLPYTTRIETPLSVWEKIGRGELDGKQAMMEHLYRVAGDFQMMIQWDAYFGLGAGSGSEDVPRSVPAKKTNMTMMLLPWILIWVLLPLSGFWGGIAGILLCAALPFAFIKFRPTIFEYISGFSVSLISLLSILAFPMDILIPISYFLFGLMWATTVFLKTPLSAWYSMNGYGEESALDNPLFIRTNRILTACWGVLYLATPIWTYALLQTPIPYLTGLVNSALPAILGLFTRWFEKWYPTHYASMTIR